MFDPASVRVRGPLQVHVAGFWVALLRQGYTPLSASNLLRVTAHLGRWLKANGLALVEVSEEIAAAFLRHRRRLGYTHLFTRRALEPLLSYLRGIGAIPLPTPVIDQSPAGRFITEYAAYLRQERGLVAITVRGYTELATQFLREELPRLEWDRLTATWVTSFVLRRARQSKCIATSKLVVTRLRSLLRYLHLRGVIDKDLSGCVPAVAGWRLAGLPKGLEASQIAILLSSFNRSPTGLRDSAIVLLLLRLGLRAAEVAALSLDDVDWRAGEISVHGKGRHESRLPLPKDVGRALGAYLRRGRPHLGTRSLLLLSRAPYSGIRSCTVTSVAQRALRRVGVFVGGAHLLRHTAATQLLRHGASLPEIAHVLRHRHLDTTAIYAKVDLASLSALAQPWPGGAP